MEQLFRQLWDIIVRSLPAFVLFVVLHFYLKRVLFQPMERVLQERRGKTKGAFEAAEAAAQAASGKLREYERALAASRAEIYAEQDAARKKLAGDHAHSIEQARLRITEKIAAAKVDIARAAEMAAEELAAEADRLAERIAGAVLGGRT